MTLISQDEHLVAGAWAACACTSVFSFANNLEVLSVRSLDNANSLGSTAQDFKRYSISLFLSTFQKFCMVRMKPDDYDS